MQYEQHRRHHSFRSIRTVDPSILQYTNRLQRGSLYNDTFRSSEKSAGLLRDCARGCYRETDFLILGKNRREISTKWMKAEPLISHNLGVQIITIDDFLRLISMEIE